MKKVVSLLLVVVLALGMATVGFAKPTNAINGFVPNRFAASSGVIERDWGDKNPGFSDTIYTFTTADFTYDGAYTAVLTKKFMTDSKIVVKNTIRAGSKALDEVKLDNVANVGVALKLSLIDPFVSTGDMDFEYRVYLQIDGTRTQDEFCVYVTGNLANPVIEVDTEDDYVDLSQGHVAEALAYIKAIEVDLGNEVYIHTKFFNGKKYYGIAETEPEDSDDEILDKYPSIDQVITLKTVGLNAAGKIVELRDFGSEYFVYNKDLKLLGKANEKLEYSTKYYLSATELAVADDEEPGDEPGEEPEEGPETGGEANVNDNPGTGR